MLVGPGGCRAALAGGREGEGGEREGGREEVSERCEVKIGRKKEREQEKEREGGRETK